jgi:hypothetical protein
MTRTDRPGQGNPGVPVVRDPGQLEAYSTLWAAGRYREAA